MARVRSQLMQRPRFIDLTELQIDPRHVIEAVGPTYHLVIFDSAAPW